MQNHPKLGEIIVPGPPRSSGTRSFILTGMNGAHEAPDMLFGLLSAETPKKIVDKLVDRLIDEIRPAYFTGSGDPEPRYELALKQANRSILAFLHEHRLSLPGIKLRGVMAALAGDALFVSNRGSLRGLIIMRKHGKAVTIPLFSDTPDTSTNPKFFSSFQQGILPHDSVFITGTKELFSAVDEAFIRRAFTERDSTDAGKEIRKGLSDKPHVALLTLAMPSEAPVQEVAVAGAAPTLSAPKPRSRRPAPGDLPTRMDIGELGAKSIEGAILFVLRQLKLIPKALVAIFRAIMVAVRLLAFAPRAARALADGERRRTLVDGAKTAPGKLARHGFHRFNALPNRSKAHLLLLLAVSAVFVHGILFTFSKHAQAVASKAYEAKLAEIGQLQTDLETSLIIGNDRRSHDAIARLEALIADLPAEEPAEIDTKREAEGGLQAQKGKLRRYVTIAEPEVLASFDDPEGHYDDAPLAWFGKSLYLFSTVGTSVKTIGLDGSVTEEALEGPAGIRTAAPALTGILLAFDDGTLGFWRPGTTTVTVYSGVSIGDSPILFYQSRLYTVRADGMIERRPILDGGLGAPTDVLIAPSDLKNPASIAADGAAYLLSPGGELRKYLKGNAIEGFTPPIIDPIPRQSESLWADPSSRWLVFLERSENRVVMVDSSTGRLAAQLVSPGFGEVTSMTVGSTGNHAYLLSGNRILSIPLRGPGIN